MFTRFSVRHFRKGTAPSSLAGLLLFLTLGVGVAEAWQLKEHADESHCVDCVLCDLATHSFLTGASAGPDVVESSRYTDPADHSASVMHLVRARRPDAARAPPA